MRKEKSRLSKPTPFENRPQEPTKPFVQIKKTEKPEKSLAIYVWFVYNREYKVSCQKVYDLTSRLYLLSRGEVAA